MTKLLTWVTRGDDALGDGYFVLRVASPVLHSHPALFRKSDISVACNRSLVEAQHCEKTKTAITAKINGGLK